MSGYDTLFLLQMPFNSDTIREAVLQIVQQPNYKPQKPKKFLEQLDLSSDDSRSLRSLIKSMVENGELHYGKSHLVSASAPASGGGGNSSGGKTGRSNSSARKETQLITGRFQRRPSGIGFVRPRSSADDIPAGDIFVPAHWTKDAASGDTVVVELLDRRPKDNYGSTTKRKKNRLGQNEHIEQDNNLRGKIVEIVARVSNRFVGSYNIQHGWGYIQIDGGTFKRMVPIGDTSSSTAKQDDKIVVEMVKYPTPYDDGEAVIVEVLGQHGVPGLDTLLIMRQFDLPEQFSDATLAAARKEVNRFLQLVREFE